MSPPDDPLETSRNSKKSLPLTRLTDIQRVQKFQNSDLSRLDSDIQHAGIARFELPLQRHNLKC